MRPWSLIPLVALAAATLRCETLRQDGGVKPEALTCTNVIGGGKDGASLRAALAGASPGDCVIVGSNTYKGSFEVPPGVTLTGEKDAQAVVSGDTNDKPALVVQGAKGSGLCKLAVRDSLGIGVAIKGGPVLIKDVTIERAKQTGLTAQCDGCGDDEAKRIALTDVRIRDSQAGAILRGGKVVWNGGQSSGNNGITLSSGVGLIAMDGVHLELSNVAVENNSAAGVVVDGRKGSTASFRDVRVAGNQERGIWAQFVEGDGALVVRGKNTIIENNALVGLGLHEVRGASVQDATIRGTKMIPQTVELAKIYVGDGLGVYAASAQVSVSGVTLAGNERAAALVDQPKSDVSLDALAISPGQSGLKVVVQRALGPDATRVSQSDLSTSDTLPAPSPILLDEPRDAGAPDSGADAAADAH